MILWNDITQTICQSWNSRLAVPAEFLPSAVLALTILAHSMKQGERPNDEMGMI